MEDKVKKLYNLSEYSDAHKFSNLCKAAARANGYEPRQITGFTGWNMNQTPTWEQFRDFSDLTGLRWSYGKLNGTIEFDLKYRDPFLYTIVDYTHIVRFKDLPEAPEAAVPVVDVHNGPTQEQVEAFAELIGGITSSIASAFTRKREEKKAQKLEKAQKLVEEAFNDKSNIDKEAKDIIDAFSKSFDINELIDNLYKYAK